MTKLLPNKPAHNINEKIERRKCTGVIAEVVSTLFCLYNTYTMQTLKFLVTGMYCVYKYVLDFVLR